jgi:hypothetical protein
MSHNVVNMSSGQITELVATQSQDAFLVHLLTRPAAALFGYVFAHPQAEAYEFSQQLISPFSFPLALDMSALCYEGKLDTKNSRMVHID